MVKSDLDSQLEADSSWKAKGNRLTYLRDLAHLERDEAAKLAGVARKTYKDWEIGAGNLSEKRARWVISEMQARGIECSLEWLLTGIGDKPQRQRLVWEQNSIISEGSAKKQSSGNAELEQQSITKELECFCRENPHSIGLVVTDDVMLPTYQKGDVVAGIQRTKEDDIKKLLGQDCIVKFPNGAVLLRNLNQGRSSNLYTLICANRKSGANILYDEEIISAAPVIWHRRLDMS